MEIKYSKGITVKFDKLKKKLITTIKLKSIKFMIGFVPVFITQTIDVYIGAEGEVVAELSVSSELSQKFKAGFNYSKVNGLKGVSDAEFDVNYKLPNIQGVASIKGMIQPQYNTKIYGEVGPSLVVKGYVGADIKASIRPADICDAAQFDYDFYIGMEAALVFNLSKKLKTLFGTKNAESKLSVTVLKPIKESIWKDTWTLCTPKTKMRVVGDSLTATYLYGATDNIINKFTIYNDGNADMDWSMTIDKDDAGGVLDRGTVSTGGNAIHNYRLDLSNLGVGTHSYNFSFINKSDKDALIVKKSLKISIMQGLEQPTIISSSISDNGNAIDLVWDISEESKRYIDSFQIFVDGKSRGTFSKFIYETSISGIENEIERGIDHSIYIKAISTRNSTSSMSEKVTVNFPIECATSQKVKLNADGTSSCENIIVNIPKKELSLPLNESYQDTCDKYNQNECAYSVEPSETIIKKWSFFNKRAETLSNLHVVTTDDKSGLLMVGKLSLSTTTLKKDDEVIVTSDITIPSDIVNGEYKVHYELRDDSGEIIYYVGTQLPMNFWFKFIVTNGIAGEVPENPDGEKEPEETENPDGEEEPEGTENPDGEKEPEGTENPEEEPVATTIISSISPTIATKGEITTFTLLGTDLPNTIAMSLHGSISCANPYSVTSTSAKIDCTPNTTGDMRFYIADKSGGTAISGSENLTINVIEKDDNTPSPRAFYKVMKTIQTLCFDWVTNQPQACTSQHKGQDAFYKKGSGLNLKRLSGKNVVSDSNTKLMWSDNSDADGKYINWDNANKYCRDLDLDSYDDWLLPSSKELLSTREYGNGDKMKSSKFVNIGDAYWSRDTYNANSLKAWFTTFSTSNSSYKSKSFSSLTRCVRYAN